MSTNYRVISFPSINFGFVFFVIPFIARVWKCIHLIMLFWGIKWIFKRIGQSNVERSVWFRSFLSPLSATAKYIFTFFDLFHDFKETMQSDAHTHTQQSYLAESNYICVIFFAATLLSAINSNILWLNYTAFHFWSWYDWTKQASLWSIRLIENKKEREWGRNWVKFIHSQQVSVCRSINIVFERVNIHKHSVIQWCDDEMAFICAFITLSVPYFFWDVFVYCLLCMKWNHLNEDIILDKS